MNSNQRMQSTNELHFSAMIRKTTTLTRTSSSSLKTYGSSPAYLTSLVLYNVNEISQSKTFLCRCRSFPVVFLFPMLLLKFFLSSFFFSPIDAFRTAGTKVEDRIKQIIKVALYSVDSTTILDLFYTKINCLEKRT